MLILRNQLNGLDDRNNNNKPSHHNKRLSTDTKLVCPRVSYEENQRLFLRSTDRLDRYFFLRKGAKLEFSLILPTPLSSTTHWRTTHLNVRKLLFQ